MNILQKLNAIFSDMPFLGAEIFLMLGFVLIVVVEILLLKKNTDNSDPTEAQNWLWGFCLAILIFTLYITLNQSELIGNISTKSNYFIVDNSSVFFKLIIILAAVILLFHIKSVKYTLLNEFYPLLIFQVFGLFLLSISSNFLLIYISIEIVSIAAYIFTTFSMSKRSIEAAIKYALFGGVSSAIMLYGISLLYGITGTLNFLDSNFSKFILQADSAAISLVFLMTIGGLLFKISAFPFHLWVPDVYETAPSPIVSFFSIAPKAMGLIVLARLLLIIPDLQKNILILIAIGSIAIGNISALRQENAKRLLAYSTIAHAGFLIGAISVTTQLGFQATYFYLFGYLFSNMAAFLLLDISDEKSKIDGYSIKNYNGLGTKYPIWGILVIIVMASLIGLPPTVGFSAKLFVFSAIWEKYQTTNNAYILILFVFGLLNTAISLYYYLKIPFVAFFRKGVDNNPFIFSTYQFFLSVFLIIPVLFYFFKADLLMNWLAMLLR